MTRISEREERRKQNLQTRIKTVLERADLVLNHFESDPRGYAVYLDLPDFAHIHDELQRHKHTTRQLLWEEYRAAHAEGYGYSQFCQLYQRWKGERDAVLRQEHRPGEKLFVDWAGATTPLCDPQNSEVRQASLFVAVLGASNYTYAEASEDQQMASWIGAHVRTFEFLGEGETTSESEDKHV